MPDLRRDIHVKRKECGMSDDCGSRAKSGWAESENIHWEECHLNAARGRVEFWCDSISRTIRYGREAGSYLWSVGRSVGRMGAGGGIVVVIVVPRWMVRLFASRRCLLDGGACATFTWLHNQGTFVRASERGELGKWENHTILRRLHHRAVVERTEQ